MLLSLPLILASCIDSCHFNLTLSSHPKRPSSFCPYKSLLVEIVVVIKSRQTIDGREAIWGKPDKDSFSFFFFSS